MKKTHLFLYLVLFIYALSFPKDLLSQNVGIGIAAPTRAKLEVNGAVGATSAIFGGETTGMSFQRNWPTIGFNQYNDGGAGRYIATGYAALQYLDPGSGTMTLDMLGTGNANAVTTSLNRAFSISANGNIGIRTTPFNSASLFVTRAGNADGSAIFGGTEFNSHFYYSSAEDTYIRGGKTGSNVYINNLASGKILIGSPSTRIGINTGNPQYSLEIRQTGLTGLLLVEPAESFNNWEQVVGFYNGGPSSSLKMLYNGQLKCFFRPTDGEHVTTSDLRVKTNIRPLGSLLNKIMQLRPVSYEMKYNNKAHQKTIGFISQEVEQVFPELINRVPGETETGGDKIPELLALDYDAFKTIAIKGVQEEEEMIRELQRRQDEMLKRLETIEKKLSKKDSKK